MSLDCILGGIHSRPRSVCVLGVIFALVCFVPVADVSQPDPLSIAGIYDAADGDDAVQAATSLESPPRVKENHCVVSPASIIAGGALTARPVLPSIPLHGPDGRSPPARPTGRQASVCLRSLLP